MGLLPLIAYSRGFGIIKIVIDCSLGLVKQWNMFCEQHSMWSSWNPDGSRILCSIFWICSYILNQFGAWFMKQKTIQLQWETSTQDHGRGQEPNTYHFESHTFDAPAEYYSLYFTEVQMFYNIDKNHICLRFQTLYRFAGAERRLKSEWKVFLIHESPINAFQMLGRKL